MSRVTDLIAERGITKVLQQAQDGELQPPLSDDETRELTSIAEAIEHGLYARFREPGIVAEAAEHE